MNRYIYTLFQLSICQLDYHVLKALIWHFSAFSSLIVEHIPRKNHLKKPETGVLEMK